MSKSHQRIFATLCLLLFATIGCKSTGLARPFSSTIWPGMANSDSTQISPKYAEDSGSNEVALANQKALEAEIIPRPAPIDSVLQDIADDSQNESARCSPCPVGSAAVGGQNTAACTDRCCVR